MKNMKSKHSKELINKKVIFILIFILIATVFTLTGCGDDEGGSSGKKSKSYSEKIKAVRDCESNTTGQKYGDTLDYALKDYEWTEDVRSVYTTYVTVTGKDKESGEKIEITWEVTDPGGNDYNISFYSFTRDGEKKDAFSASAYVREYGQELKNKNEKD